MKIVETISQGIYTVHGVYSWIVYLIQNEENLTEYVLSKQLSYTKHLNKTNEELLQLNEEAKQEAIEAYRSKYEPL